jgi:hypothetical protein
MKKMMIVFSALVLISVAASAQVRSNVRASAPQPDSKPAIVPGACSPCLWYAGDTDPSNPSWDADLNFNGTFAAEENQIWVPFIAASDGNPLHKHVLISAVTFNEVAATPDTNPPADYAGMSYGFRTGVLSGNGGTLHNHGTCPATVVTYTGVQAYGVYNEYAFTCQLLGTKAVKVPVGTIYWVNITPTFTVSTFAYLDDAIDVPELNHLGWGNDFDNSFINGAAFSLTYAPADGVAGGLEQFSVAIAGTYVP